MTVKESILDFGTGQWGEDRLHAGETLAFVIDGATPISQTPYGAWHSNAEWMAEALKNHLVEAAPKMESIPQSCMDFADHWREKIRQDFPGTYHQPSLTVAAIRMLGDRIRGCVLGDCAIYVLTASGKVHCLSDRRTGVFYQRTLSAKARAEEAGEDVEQAVIAQRIRNKSTMNQPGGYWTVSCTGDFRREFYRFDIRRDCTCGILLCTDGFDRLFVSGMLKPEQIFSGEYTLRSALELLREKEKSITEDVKQHDDAAAVLMCQ